MVMVPIRQQMRDEIRLRGLAESTEKTYLSYAARLVDFHHHRPPRRLTAADVRRFFVHMIDARHASPASIRVALAAVCFLFRVVLHRPWVVANLPRPRVPRRQQVVLAPEEVWRLFDHIGSLTMRTMAFLVYATGLREREARFLQPQDVDSARHVIVVRKAKGRREREVPLGIELLVRLRHYWRVVQPGKKNPPYLFPGEVTGQPLSRGALGKALARAAHSAGILKRVGPHVLRHSSATHYLEMGVNQFTIQTVLGHAQGQTTTLYTHVTSEHLGRLKTPFDVLVRRMSAKAEPDNKS